MVNSAQDVATPPAGVVTLRSALLAANADPGSDTITFSPALAGQTIPVPPVQVTGVLSQYLSRSAAQSGYRILPRTRDDVRPGPGDYGQRREPNR